MPFFWARRRPSHPNDERQKEVDRLQKELEQLRIANEQLKEQLAARSVHLGEYLYKWKTIALPLLGSEWELRYWALSGTTLSYYRSAKDTAFSPREEFNILSCFVAWEGLRSGRFWTFSLLDSGGALMVRLATRNRDGAERWLAALEAAGCVRDDSLAPPDGPKGSVEASRRSYEDPALIRSYSAPSAVPRPRSASGVVSGDTAPVEAATPSKKPSKRARVSATTQPPSAPGGAAATTTTGFLSVGRSAAGKGVATATVRLANGHAATVLAAAPAGVDATPALPSATVTAAAEVASPPPLAQPQAVRRSLGNRPGGPERGPMFGSTPVHTACRFSLLSSERVWYEKHTGLYNLALIILVLTNFRLALENALKYGFRLNPVRVVGDLMAGRAGGGAGGLVNVPLVLCYPVLLAAALLSLGSELAGDALLKQEFKLRDQLSKRKEMEEEAVAREVRVRARGHEWLLFLANLASTSCVIGLPWAVISLTRAEPISGGILITLAVVLWMKLVSYHHCCFDLRTARRCGEIRPGERGCPDTPAEDWGQLAKYPENLTLRNLMYFLAVPTLTYQVNFPRSRTFRGRWVLRRVFELAITLTALAILIGQYIEPAVTNSMAPLRQMDFPRVVERILKLALPSTYAWLLCFYCLFHLWLNVLAELTGFGDREFYKDWWNAGTVGEYWKLWNMPVHKWLLRHVYFPAVRAGSSRFNAILLTFFVSAVFHELILGVPLHLVRLWAFFGIIFQVPLILVTEKLRKQLRRDELGNFIFWIAFCVVGQPVSVLLYYHDYMVGIRPTLLAMRVGPSAVNTGILFGEATNTTLGVPISASNGIS
ncbi:hypothetical protein Vafri_11070 [Volvox africanus]|uniref:diacylglycerol O-acyltransferase n=1 Tax=Volvox africanus TaxID=51714 RepID=A0A8J4BBM7_9CHLO|nr:hypothetical protein Vafri_11070 [Volvox africanus]